MTPPCSHGGHRRDDGDPDDTSRPPLSRREAVRAMGRFLARMGGVAGLGWLDLPPAALLLAGTSPNQSRNHQVTSPMPASRPSSKKAPASAQSRLPRHVRPTGYALSIAPDLRTASFEGEVVITLRVARSTRDVILNAVDLEIVHASIGRPNRAPQIGRPHLVPEAEQCRITFPQSVTTGEWSLHLRFKGRLNDHLHGFYRSTFTDAQGMTQTLAVTQFEAADARRAFPCWDEPDFKAVFSLTLIIDPNLTAIANTRVLSEHVELGRKTIRFADTIVMSTYLVAFVIGQLEGTPPSFVGQTPVRVWSTPGKSHLATYGLELATFSLRFFEEYYGIGYPGDKLDLIAIPDFSHGAMENLGAITFRERALLIDPVKATRGELEGLADVVCHENAHMWFGDLVTMSWWNGLWLNEAFATFLEVVAVDAWKPEWRRWESFALARAGALATDGLFASRPIEFPVQTVKDLGAMFDVLTYQKGAAVLRMLEQYLGATVFRDGVRDYLRTHAYANAETSDLWRSLGKVSRQPIPEIMNQWVYRPGFPLLTVSLHRGSHLRIRQQRFTYLNTPPESDSHLVPLSGRWRIPVQLALHTPHGVVLQTVVLDRAEQRIKVPDNLEFALLNSGGHGYYRVHYAPDLLHRLLGQLPEGLSANDRFNLINDAWAACQAGIMSLRDFLDMTVHFKQDRSPHVWAVLLSAFTRLESLVAPAMHPALEALVQERLRPALADLGWLGRPGEDDLRRDLRGDLIGSLGTLGNDPEVQTKALTLYTASLSNTQAVDPNLLPALIDIAAFTGDETRYHAFFSRFKQARTPQEERRYLYSLAGFRPPDLVARTLASTLNGDIRTQDGTSVIAGLLSTTHGREAAWEFMKTNWKTLEERFPANGLRRLFGHLSGLSTPELEQDVRRFVTRNRIDLGGKALAQDLEQLRIAVVFRQREAANLHAHLSTLAAPR